MADGKLGQNVRIHVLMWLFCLDGGNAVATMRFGSRQPPKQMLLEDFDIVGHVNGGKFDLIFIGCAF